MAWRTVLSNQKKEEEAEEPLRRAVELNSGSLARARLAYSLALQGKYDEAIDECKECVRRGVNETFAWAIHGFVLRKENDLDGAEKKLREALHQYRVLDGRDGVKGRLNRAYGWALKQLGQVLEARGRPEEAMDLYRRALKLFRGDIYARRWLERLENQEKDSEPNR